MRKTLLQTLLAAFAAILCNTFCIGGGGMNIGARVGMWGDEFIPYERVTYVQSNGSGSGNSTGTRIDTGLSCKTKYIAEIDVAAINTGVLCGCWNSNANPRVYLLRFMNTTQQIGVGYYSQLQYFDTGSSVTERHLYRIENRDEIKVYVDGLLINTFATESALSNERTLGLFYNNSTGATDNVSARLYGMKVWRSSDGVLVRNYVPVKTPTDKGGLYDTVNKELKVNESDSSCDLTYG